MVDVRCPMWSDAVAMSNPSTIAPRTSQMPIRVRYVECDPMNVAHHSAYAVWLEMVRTQLLREQGHAYRDLEARGILFVVARLNIRYRRPALYDDELTVHVEAKPCAGVKIDHVYQVKRGDELITTADSTIVCVDRAGKLQPVPAELRI